MEKLYGFVSSFIWYESEIVDDNNVYKNTHLGNLHVLLKDPQIQAIISIGIVLLLFGVLMKILNSLSTFMYDIAKYIVLWMICMFIYQVLSSFVTPFFLLQNMGNLLQLLGVSIPEPWNITNIHN